MIAPSSEGLASAFAGEPAARSEAPAEREAPLQQEVIERVLLTLARLPPRLDRAPIKAALDAAHAALTRWRSSGPEQDDHLARLDASIVHVAEARARLAAAEGAIAAEGSASLAQVEGALQRCRGATMDAMVAAEAARPKARPAAREAPPPFRAGAGVPSLHVLDRAPLVPHVDVAPPFPAPAPGDGETGEDDDLLEEAPASAPHAPASAPRPEEAGGEPGEEQERGRCLRAARGHMENIATFGSLRCAREAGPWRAMERCEAHLLADLDALAVLAAGEQEGRRDAGVLRALLAFAGEMRFPDAGRAFARAFVLGCIDGDDAVRAIVVGLRTSDPRTLAAQRRALCLASSPRLAPALTHLTLDADPALARLALDVLRFRREASPAVLLALIGQTDPGVREAAARCLAAVEPRDAARSALSELLHGDEDVAVRLAAAEGLTLLGSAEGLRFAADHLDADGRPAPSDPVAAGCLRLLALAGGPEHVHRIARAAAGSPEGAEAIGWFGHTALVEPLLAELAAANDARRRRGVGPTRHEHALSNALARITGARFPDPAGAPGAGVPIQAARWRVAWEELRGALRSGQRYRSGRPYTPLVSLDELASPGAAPRDRASAAFEIGVALAPDPWSFEPADWIARQDAVLAETRALLASVEGAPGEWPAQRLARRLHRRERV